MLDTQILLIEFKKEEDYKMSIPNSNKLCNSCTIGELIERLQDYDPNIKIAISSEHRLTENKDSNFILHEIKVNFEFDYYKIKEVV